MSGKGKSSLWYLVSKLQPAASPDHPSYVSLILHGEKEEDEQRPSWLQASAMSLVSSGRAFKREAPASAIAHHCHKIGKIGKIGLKARALRYFACAL